MTDSGRTQFGLRRLLGVTAGIAAFVAGPKLVGAPPAFSTAAAIVGVSIGIFVLLTSRRTWFLSGVPVVGAIVGLLMGVCLYQSPLPGFLYGVLAGIAISQDVVRSPNRRWVALRGTGIALVFAFIPCLYTWKHLRARYVFWGARVKAYDDHTDNPIHRALELAFGPHIVPSSTIVWFQDEPRRGISYTDDVLRRFAPHLESMHGLREIVIKDCPKVSDTGVAQLANVRHLTYLSIESKRVTTEGIRQLRHTGDLEALEVYCPLVGDEIVSVLRKYPKLRVLNLYYSSVSDEATRKFADFPSLHQLGTSDSVTDETIATLRRSLTGHVGRLEQ